ncbi:Crp/Fnr family transcriptional regulator [Candidatus Izimaplasma bacterium HR1]|jgi:CRP/FNR family transcriptional regulator|uniref:Crp/Fnr family transcriptional regulator n=1 Tax=Candidatus Izimoplasma sp. HR1 TaxID=1541959 RepID=UPI000570FCEE
MKQYCNTCIYSTLPTKTIQLHEKDVIFLEGDELLYSFMIVEGLVKISKITINGEEKIFDIFGPDDFIALVSMLKEDDKYIATATCLTEVKLNLLRKDDVIQAYRSNNKFKDICMSCAMTRTNLFQSQLFNSTNSDIEERILQVLKYLSTKFGKSTGDLLTLKLPFSKTTLASIVGIRRETLSRRLTSMQKDNLIEINKNIYKFNRM